MALLAASCAKEIETQSPEYIDGELTLSASIADGMDSKVNFTEENDKILLRWNASSEAFTTLVGDTENAYALKLEQVEGSLSEDGKTTTFSTTVAGQLDPQTMLYAIYPAQDIVTGNAKAIPLDLSSQSGTSHNQNLNYMYATGSAASLTQAVIFRHLTSVLCLDLKFEQMNGTAIAGTAKDITISAEGLTTAATVDLTAAEPVITPTASGSVKLTGSFELTDGAAKVYLYLLPGTVKDINVVGYVNGVPYKAVVSKGEAGKEVLAGKHFKAAATAKIQTCSSPVEWPIGYIDGVAQVTKESQPRWNPGKTAEHVWLSSQPSASITYNIVETTNGAPSFELNNHVNLGNNAMTAYNYAAPCIKSIGTGDYFEFKVPVERIAANTEITLTLPTYGRGNPLFWDVEYLDGSDWKCNRTEHTSVRDRNDANKFYTETCTLMIEHGEKSGTQWAGNVYTVKMTVENEINNDYLCLRLKCVTREIISSIARNNPNLAVKIGSLSRPVNYDNLFTFVNKTGACTAISIAW